MLTHLSITNYAIIENIELPFNKGFTVITGETGAGKSILLGALSLILGKRADTSVLNNKEKKCIVEGAFELNQSSFQSFFDEHDIDFEETTILRREINANGKSRAFINDTPVTINLLNLLSSKLIDIHSQHQTLSLQENKFQLNVLDSFCGITSEVEEYKIKYNKYLNHIKLLNELIASSNRASSDIDYITFQVNELEELNLKPNEKEEIQSELQLLNNAEEIKQVLENAGTAFNNEQFNLLVELKSIVKSFNKIAHCAEEYAYLENRLTSVAIELEDIAKEIEDNSSKLNFDSGNLSYLNERLGKIFNIEQKHHVSTSEEIINLLESFKSKLSQMGSYDQQITNQKEIVIKLEIELFKIAEVISQKRNKAILAFSESIISKLNLLGMPDATFNVNSIKHDKLSDNGVDDMIFLFSANKGVELKELSKTASGGELSRLMLTIKSVLTKSYQLSSIIFDEIDTGVSGDIADKMASIMKNMSENVQVIAITHLPQVAAKGEWHYKIYKETRNEKTNTLLEELSDSARVDELAKMLSGEKLTSIAKENARILLEN